MGSQSANQAVTAVATGDSAGTQESTMTRTRCPRCKGRVANQGGVKWCPSCAWEDDGNPSDVGSSPEDLRLADTFIEDEGGPRSIAVASKGIETGRDLANLLTALMADVLDGTVEDKTANTICAVADRLIRVADLQYREKLPR